VRRALIAVLLLQAPTALAGEAFDWDRYHERQDACREKYRSFIASDFGGLDGRNRA
jgi:hypothetical protein